MTSSDKDVIVTEESNVLSAEELASAYERWEAPTMVSISDVENNEFSIPTAKEIEALRKSAQEDGFKDGFEKGLHDGLQAGQAEIQQQVTKLQSLMASLNQPLLDIEDVIEQQVVHLTTLLTQQIVHNELKTSPEHITTAFQAAIAQLPLNNRQLKIRINPEDLELVKKGLLTDAKTEWQWVEDAQITRGGFELDSIDTRIDATVETRIASAVEKLLGEVHSNEQAE